MLRITEASARHDRKGNDTRPRNVQSEGRWPRPLHPNTPHSEWASSSQTALNLTGWLVDDSEAQLVGPPAGRQVELLPRVVVVVGGAKY